MLKIFIPSDLKYKVNRKAIFILARPFYSNNNWVMDDKQLKKWGNLNTKETRRAVLSG